ncbi:4845_t:CDS:2 [Diversispora eburnea]|uniref:4845_t:CDS:1 n=1 Tax=Diversispora eburnea TaxID=1213867 RepID=A0A9N9FQE1_9GLOM|nr:4845_t:CDS:2 [Diversispora eburnea]
MATKSLRAQVSKSKALDDITNAIIGKQNYATSARESAMSSFNIKISSKQIFTWNHVIQKMEIKENSTKDWINDGHNFSDDFRKFQKSIIEKLKTDPTLSYATDIESIM